MIPPNVIIKATKLAYFKSAKFLISESGMIINRETIKAGNLFSQAYPLSMYAQKVFKKYLTKKSAYATANDNYRENKKIFIHILILSPIIVAENSVRFKEINYLLSAISINNPVV